MTLIRLKDDDLDLILEWRNAPNVRQNMYTSHVISKEEHLAWFEGVKNNTSAQWFVFHEDDGEPAGVVCFKNIDNLNCCASWGFYAANNARPGVGTRMEYEALEYAFQECKLQKLTCEVLATNIKVINLHEKFGFVKKELAKNFHFDGKKYFDVVEMEILVAEWFHKRESVLSRIRSWHKK